MAVGRSILVAITPLLILGHPSVAIAEEKPVVGFIHIRSASQTKPLVAAFRHALSKNGFIEGKNLIVEYRFANGQRKQLPALIAGLVNKRISVLVAGSDPVALAGKKLIGKKPMIFAVGEDPIKLGLVKSINLPGGNITGISIIQPYLEAKRLSLLNDLLPRGSRIGILLNPDLPLAQQQILDIQSAAKKIGMPIQPFWAAAAGEIEASLESIGRQKFKALMVAGDPFFDTQRQKFITFSLENRIPTMFPFREYPVSGGLMSYGIKLTEVYARMGEYTARILRGANPAVLPVLRPTEYELVINLKAAHKIGIKIPPKILSLANEIIE